LTPFSFKVTLDSNTLSQDKIQSYQYVEVSMSTSVTCQKCGYSNNATAKFCSKCSTSLLEKTKKCYNCETPNKLDAAYCQNCAMELSTFLPGLTLRRAAEWQEVLNALHWGEKKTAYDKLLPLYVEHLLTTQNVVIYSNYKNEPWIFPPILLHYLTFHLKS
jgi:hypothetical protein